LGLGLLYLPTLKSVSKSSKSRTYYDLGANGTAIEGDGDKAFECVRKCHEKIHAKGSPRIYTTMKVNIRTDKEQKFADKVKSVLGN
tara:strand:- start:217 stop:474 length:258 start_codon:yes stop_codon:yes gene_type:complete